MKHAVKMRNGINYVELLPQYLFDQCFHEIKGFEKQSPNSPNKIKIKALLKKMGYKTEVKSPIFTFDI